MLPDNILSSLFFLFPGLFNLLAHSSQDCHSLDLVIRVMGANSLLLPSSSENVYFSLSALRTELARCPVLAFHVNCASWDLQL